MSVVQDQLLVQPGDLFPFRPASGLVAGAAVRPFGVALAEPVEPAEARDTDLTLGYSHNMQVATIGGAPAVEVPEAAPLMDKKRNTVHDTTPFPDETNQ